MELEEGAEAEDSDEQEPAHVPMTPAERRAEWKKERQRTAVTAEAVAPATPMLQSSDSESGAGDSPAADSPAVDKREEWRRNRQASALQAEEIAPGSASPPATRQKPERPQRRTPTDSDDRSEQVVAPSVGSRDSVGSRGTPIHSGLFFRVRNAFPLLRVLAELGTALVAITVSTDSLTLHRLSPALSSS